MAKSEAKARVIQVVCPDGVRRSISIGRVDEAASATAEKWIRSVAGALRHGEPADPRASRWLATVPDKVHA